MTPRPPSRGSATALAWASILFLAACASAGSEAGGPGGATGGASPDETFARVVQVFLPPDVTGAGTPLVVLVPGGGWVSADPAGLVPLAEELARAGTAVVTTTYRTQTEGASFPVPLEDVVCSVDEAAREVASRGVDVGPVVVAGHSAGAQLSALAALVGDAYQDGCPSPPVAIAGFVGLAGPYDIVAFADVATGLFVSTPAEDPETWLAANPIAQVRARPELPVLLLHGKDDDNVPMSSSRGFAAALKDSGHQVTLTVVPGVDHFQVYGPEVAAAPIEDFVTSLERA